MAYNGVPQRSPFLGPAYTARSPVLALDQCINLYPEIVERETSRGTTKEVGALYGTPGLTSPVVTLGSGPIRGMWVQGLSLYVVSGNTLYRLNSSFTPTTLGTLSTSTGFVEFVANNVQVGVVDSSGFIYVWNYQTNTYSTVALPTGTGLVPSSATALNGFSLVNQALTQRLWQSNYNDLTTWDPLNFANADATPDNGIGLGSLHNQVYVFKEAHIEVWPNAGQAGFAFQRIPGVLPEIGCSSPATIVKVADSLIWLGRDQQGYGKVYRIRGYEPQRVSNFAIEQAINGYAIDFSVFAFGYSQAGHDFYCLSFPANDITWCLDITATEQMGVPMWHQRGQWHGALSTFGMFPGCCSTLFGGVAVGDYVNGNIYRLDLNTYTDNGLQKRWLRSWRERPDFNLETFRVNALEIEYDSAGAAGTYTLRQSDDGGETWSSNVRTAAFGGSTQARAKFNRLGMTARGAQSDRVFELSSTDPVKTALLGAWVC